MTNKIPSLFKSSAMSALLLLIVMGGNRVFAIPPNIDQSAPKSATLPNSFSNAPTVLTKNWQIISDENKVSDGITLPMLAPSAWDRVTFRNIFLIPEKFQNMNLRLRIGNIRGIASMKLNNIPIRRRLNYPTNFNISIPQNLLNPNGENTLEIIIKRPDSPDEGIPEMVRLFSRESNLGICGKILLSWEQYATFPELTWQYQMNNLEYQYKIFIDDPETISKAPFAKIRCEEEILAPDGKMIHKRFEYIDLNKLNKQISRSIHIPNPQHWSADTSLFYTLRFKAISDAGLVASSEQKIALREFTIKSGQFYINNQLTKIKGCTYRIRYPVYSGTEDPPHPGLFYEQIKNDLIDIKQIGFNAIRFPQEAAHPYCFDLADSLGLYLFIENGLWRVPEPYFKNDRLLQAAKTIADEAISAYAHHPSFLAFGIGTEIPIHMPAVEKFMLILKRYIQQKYPVALYAIPINYQYLKAKPITDFYIYNKYESALLTDYKEATNNFKTSGNIQPLWGNAGFSLSDIDEDNDISEDIQANKLISFFKLLYNIPEYNGFFIETYRDWQSNVPTRFTLEIDKDTYLYPYGLLEWNGSERPVYHLMPKLLNNQIPEIGVEYPNPKKSNFFSISVFILSVFFFYIYQRDYRFRENLKRSLFHPFGFFVDLRDRRIISILDSSIVGIYTNFLVASIVAAYLFYMRINLLFDEYVSSILVPLNLKHFYVSLIDSPAKITFFIWIIFYLMQLAVVIILKILNLFAVENIRFRQYLAVCNWAGAPLLFLLPASLLSYHLMYNDWYHWLSIALLSAFFLWYNFRLGNSLRVLLTMRIFKTFSLLILAYGGVFFLFGAIFESKYGLITYFNILNDAILLF